MTMRYKGGRDFKRALTESTLVGIWRAAAWLTEAMKMLVNKECPVYHGHDVSYASAWGKGEDFRVVRSFGHSPPGQPPYRESGAGQASIDWAPTAKGAKVGVVSMGIGNMTGGNYMAGWDSPDGIRGIRHPWLSLWRRYEREMAAIMRRTIKEGLGAR